MLNIRWPRDEESQKRKERMNACLKMKSDGSLKLGMTIEHSDGETSVIVSEVGSMLFAWKLILKTEIDRQMNIHV